MVTSIHTTKSDSSANKKNRSFKKLVLSFYSFSVSVKETFPPIELAALKPRTKMNKDKKSRSSKDKLKLEV